MTFRRVAITGLGVLGPYGYDKDAMFEALMRGKSAVGAFEVQSHVGKIEVVGAATREEPWENVGGASHPTCDRISLYALAAVDAALRDAALELRNADLDRVGVAVGTSLGGVISQESAYDEVLRQGKPRLSPFTLVRVMYNGPASQVALTHQLAGPSLTYSTTCSSSSVSVGEAMRSIRHGYSDVMIAGGSEAPFAYVSIKAWQAMHVLAPPNLQDVARTCRPFNRDRNGTVLGDGAAFLILEEMEHAKKRGVRIYAELVGYGVCNDALHLTQPSIEGQIKAMRLALDDARLPFDSIDYVNAHGTGTKLNDVTETRAIRETFGDHADRLAVSSTKSMHGHLIGAAGALELVISTLAVYSQRVPPTANLNDPDPDCDLDFVPNVGRSLRVNAALSNSFAVGGTAAVLVVRSIN
jgi:3-oxoacyl-[acyl-carrier-protein] synthase II